MLDQNERFKDFHAIKLHVGLGMAGKMFVSGAL